MRPLRSVPLYGQVRDELARRIAEQKLPAGSVLPNEFVLSEGLGVSVGTVRKALDILRAEKLVIRSQGRGTLVAGASSADLRCKFDGVRDADGAPVAWRFDVLERKIRRAGATEREKLKLDEGEDIVELVRRRRAADRLVLREHCHVPLAAFGDLSDLAAEDTTIEGLAYRNGVMISRIDERLSIEPADAGLADLFSLAEGWPLLRLERLALDGAQRPLEWRITHCHLGGYRYHASASIDSRQPAPRPRAPLAAPQPRPGSWRP